MLSKLVLHYMVYSNLCKLRCRDHQLPVNNTRFASTSRSEMLCMFCDTGDIGDEFHYVFSCKYFIEQRKECLGFQMKTNPNMLMLENIFQTKSIYKLAKFASIIIKHFQANKDTINLNSLALQNNIGTVITRSGREINRPDRLNL